jgi:hypothetical protein
VIDAATSRMRIDATGQGLAVQIPSMECSIK